MVSRTVLRPSHIGARALCEWAVDLWPYLNGKALVSGLKLEEMELSDMLDVLHYYMEEDYNFSNAEQIEAKSNLRKTIYRSMYNTEYKFGASSGKNKTYTASGVDLDNLESVEPVDPLKEPTKSYVPPTDFNPESIKPFGDVLDSPINL
jgi:hypothetical protein